MENKIFCIRRTELQPIGIWMFFVSWMNLYLNDGKVAWGLKTWHFSSGHRGLQISHSTNFSCGGSWKLHEFEGPKKPYHSCGELSDAIHRHQQPSRCYPYSWRETYWTSVNFHVRIIKCNFILFYLTTTIDKTTTIRLETVAVRRRMSMISLNDGHMTLGDEWNLNFLAFILHSRKSPRKISTGKLTW